MVNVQILSGVVIFDCSVLDAVTAKLTNVILPTFFAAAQGSYHALTACYLVRDLGFNSLSGTIPNSLALAKRLRKLYVQWFP